MSLIIAKFTRGTRELNINDLTNYEIGRDFNPPAISMDPIYARGGSDWWTPGKLVGMKADYRSFSFGVHCYGATEAIVSRRVRALDEFVRSGTPTEPVFLEVLGNSDVGFEPLWGQAGARFRYQVIMGQAEATEYAFGGIRTTALPECNVTLTISPFALGKKQRLGLASGCIIEDVIGAMDGQSRGIMVPVGATNLFINPVFGNSTWNTGWTAGGSLVEEQNIDRVFTLPDRRVSAKLISPATGTNIYTQSYTHSGSGAPYVVSLYVRLPDGGAITSQQCQVWYDSAKSSTYESLGNGVYRVWAAVTSIIGAQLVGIKVQNGFTVYLLGAQFETGANHSPLFHGDMLGCTWDTTRHASASIRRAGLLYVHSRSIYNVNQGTIRIVWKPTKSYWDYSGKTYLFCDTSGNFDASFDGSNNYFVLGDGTNSAVSNVTTFQANVAMVLHFTWGDGGMKIYRNGVDITNAPADYTPPAIPTRLYIGSDAAGVNQIEGIFMGFTSYERKMTDTEVLADYNNQVGIVNADKRVDWIPYLNTLPGDGKIYNENKPGSWFKWGAINSIPGSVEADTEWNGALSSHWSTIKSLWMSLLDTDVFLYQHNEMGEDSSDLADAACEGGEYEAWTVSTTPLDWYAPIDPSREYYSALQGREYALFVRLQDAAGASGLQASNKFRIASGQSYQTDNQAIASSTSWRTWISPMLTCIPIAVDKIGSNLVHYLITQFFIPVRTAGSWSLKVDYLIAMYRPLVRLRSSGSVAEDWFYFHGRDAFTHAGTPYNLHERLSLKGDVLELVPGRWNILTLHMGDTDFDPVITYYTTFNYITITPRWGLL